MRRLEYPSQRGGRLSVGGAIILRWTVSVVLLVAGLVLLPGATTAQAQDETGPVREFLGPFEVPSRYRALADSAREVEEEIAVLASPSDLEQDLESERERMQDLKQIVGNLSGAEYVRPERISRVRDQAIQLEQRLESVRERIISRLEALDDLRVEWGERKEFWEEWRASLAGEPGLSAVEPEFRRAFERIDAVLTQIEGATPPILELQEEAAALGGEAEQIAQQVATMRSGRLRALLERGRPLLFTSGFFANLSREELRDWSPVREIKETAIGPFLRAHAGLIVLNVLLGLVLFVLAVRLRSRSIPEGAWSGLLLRPRSLAIFGSVALLSNEYVLTPALWDVLIWSLLAGSGAALAARLIDNRSLRRMVYLFAGFYPLFLLSEALHVPPPLFRLLLVTAAVVGLLFFASLLSKERSAQQTDRRVIWPLGLGMLMWLTVLAAESLGFYLLARWILHATITSGYVVFIVVFLMVLAHGATRTLVRMEATGRLSFLQTVGIPLIERLLKIFRIVLVVVALLHVADIWEIAPSPAETWRTVTALGLTVAGIEITIGRLFAAAILIYLSWLISWIVRAVARSEMYPRWELERGVGDSINSLVHYTLITVGVLIGLSALGVELQNFAIIAGALGVGIGFGLQNIVNNFVSGLILLFERPVRAGDTVVIEGELGTIKKIGLRSTVVQTFDQAEVIVPNGDLVSEKVT
ncbi:MAG: mechanosensitive ion channel domain-containing protein, partial [Bacteroidota bacterium]